MGHCWWLWATPCLVQKQKSAIAHCLACASACLYYSLDCSASVFFTNWHHRELLLTTFLLLVGTMNTLFATYDIWQDCVYREVSRSDAYKYAELLDCACASPRCVGAVWLLLSLIMAL